jgi:peptide/nickel transport system ATP-binding protein
MSDDHPENSALLSVRDLAVEFPLGRGKQIQAVAGVSFTIANGETLGLVGESGCGKSTIARSIVRLQKPSAGTIRFDGEELTSCNGKRLREIRSYLQMIFQDAAAALNPGRSVGCSIAEPLRAAGGTDRKARLEAARRLMGEVGLDPDRDFGKRPFEFSGGQCQRISIARALIARPKLLICDEPVSSLDVSIQAQILNLLEAMKRRFKLTMLFISHDLAVVKNVSDRVAVMYMGKICEIAPSEKLYRAPHHPYSALLLASVPEPNRAPPPQKSDTAAREMPSPADPPPGCRFHTRCPQAKSRCREVEPGLTPLSTQRQVACHFPLKNTT